MSSDGNEGTVCVLGLWYSFCVGWIVELRCVLVSLDFHLDARLVAAVT